MLKLKDKWSHRFDWCAECGTTERPHRAKALCTRCYGRWRDRNASKNKTDYYLRKQAKKSFKYLKIRKKTDDLVTIFGQKIPMRLKNFQKNKGTLNSDRENLRVFLIMRDLMEINK